MSDTVIQVEQLSKRYRIGVKEDAKDALVSELARVIRHPMKNLRQLRQLSDFGESDIEKNTLWALKDVSFEIKRGEAIAIIGKNGSGKSTLLKILSRITAPTSGRVILDGHTASLLEVGTGFHPELTGRENVYLNGTLLGMRKKEVDLKFDEIIDFAGVEKFLDTPIKRYSSGMQMRLAFSVAANLAPEILIVDEVLAVGDAEFQVKCLKKMADFAKQGNTVLFVSHNMNALITLCSRGYWLDRGTIRESNDMVSLATDYAKLGETPEVEKQLIYHPRRGGNFVMLKHIKLLYSNDGVYQTDHVFGLEVECELDPAILKNCSLGITVKDEVGTPIFANHSNQTIVYHVDDKETLLFRAQVDRLALLPGTYSISLFLADELVSLDYIEDAITFGVVWDSQLPLQYAPRKGWGMVYVPVNWQLFSQKQQEKRPEVQ